jgi:hypothetical protein
MRAPLLPAATQFDKHLAAPAALVESTPPATRTVMQVPSLFWVAVAARGAAAGTPSGHDACPTHGRAAAAARAHRALRVDEIASRGQRLRFEPPLDTREAAACARRFRAQHLAAPASPQMPHSSSFFLRTSKLHFVSICVKTCPFGSKLPSNCSSHRVLKSHSTMHCRFLIAFDIFNILLFPPLFAVFFRLFQPAEKCSIFLKIALFGSKSPSKRSPHRALKSCSRGIRKFMITFDIFNIFALFHAFRLVSSEQNTPYTSKRLRSARKRHQHIHHAVRFKVTMKNSQRRNPLHAPPRSFASTVF